ncbi:MAG: hypothetical protein JWQ04_3591, partial [Pedosphaera sp.]|nr:hypothetical protein [Pedosphaera sp.]
IDRLERQLAERGVAGRRLQTSHAFHSAMMDPVIAPFTELLQQTNLREPSLPYVSNLTAQWITPTEATNPKYWAGHVRQTVRFADGVGELLKEPHEVLLEVGPGQTLGMLARQHPAHGPGQAVISSLAASKDPQLEVSAMLNALGKLWLSGVAVDWTGFHQPHQRRRVPLPTYPFERKRFWAEPGARAYAQPALASRESNASPVGRLGSTPANLSSDENLPSGAAAITRKERVLATLRSQLAELSGKNASEISPAVSFLELGFDSLFLAQASQSFQKTFGLKITFRQLMENLTTLDDLANYFDQQLPTEVLAQPAPARDSSPTPNAAKEDQSAEAVTLPMSEAQTELWLATRWGEDASRAFNQVVCLQLRGPLQLDALRASLDELVARHDALRTTFMPDGSGQKIAPTGKIELSLTDLSASSPTGRETPHSALRTSHSNLAQIARVEDETPFDLVRGPLLRAQLVRLAEGEHVLLLATHHLVMDGWSIGVVLRELGLLYSARVGGASEALKPALQFRDYLQWQNTPENRTASVQAQAYWLKQFANPPAPIELPGDHARPAAQSYRAGCESLALKPALHQSLKEAAARQGVTLFTYLLASLNVWLHRLGGQEDLAVGIPAAGQIAVGGSEAGPDGR